MATNVQCQFAKSFYSFSYIKKSFLIQKFWPTIASFYYVQFSFDSQFKNKLKNQVNHEMNINGEHGIRTCGRKMEGTDLSTGL